MLPTSGDGAAKIWKRLRPHALVCVEPAHDPIEGILPARALTRVGAITHEDMTLPVVYATVRSPDTRPHVMLPNYSSEALTTPKATVLGIAEEITESVLSILNK